MLDVIWFNAIIISPGATLLDEPSHAIDAKKLQPHVKVIMAAAVDLPEFLELPIDAFIQKPFSIASLEETLQRVLILMRSSDE